MRNSSPSDRIANADEIEITPEMAERGVFALMEVVASEGDVRLDVALGNILKAVFGRQLVAYHERR